MDPASSAPPAKHKPAKSDPAPAASSGADAAQPPAPPAQNPPAPKSIIEPDGSYILTFKVDPAVTRRLLTRTGRATVEEQERELLPYINRLVRRTLEDEVF